MSSRIEGTPGRALRGRAWHLLLGIAMSLAASGIDAVQAAGAPATITKLSGDRQFGSPGAAFPIPFRVRVADAAGNPVAGATVRFAVGTIFDCLAWSLFACLDIFPTIRVGIDGGQGGESLIHQTNAAGVVEARLYSSNPTLGSHAITATVDSVDPSAPSESLTTAFSVFTRNQFVPPYSGAEVMAIEYVRSDLEHYFITVLDTEIAKLDAGVYPGGWKRTFGGFVVYPDRASASATARPVCRFYSIPLDSHFYTADPVECETVIARWPQVWTLETREAFYAEVPDPATGQCPFGMAWIYRVYNNRPDVSHRYTTNRFLRDEMVGRGWIREEDSPDGPIFCAR